MDLHCFFASKDLQADKAVVLEAVKKYGTALSHASASLRADKAVALEALKQLKNQKDCKTDPSSRSSIISELN